jgi:hypothetical protein
MTQRESNLDIDRRLAESRRLGERMERSGRRAVRALRAAANVLRNHSSSPADRPS